MKKILLPSICAVALFSFSSCSREGVRERPENIVPTGARAEVYRKIMEEFPEHKNVKNSHDTLFKINTAKQVVLTKESAVYLTFISEGASYGNTFGYYIYTSGSKPSEPAQIQKHVLFPHVSDRILKQGDRLQLGGGTFPAGTVIGFFLIIDGWEAGEIKYDRETFYTDYDLNTDDQQQHVLFQQKDLGDIVLAFEDILTTHESDQDFNDIIFTVTDNTQDKEVTSFDLENVVGL